MHAVTLLIIAGLVFALSYRYYTAFIAAKVLTLDGQATTPAWTKSDGQNFVPTNRWVLFGHHFAAISGAGPLIGPVLAAQWGYAPGFLWILFGAVLGGGVHDAILLLASVRNEGGSLLTIARRYLSPFAAIILSLFVMFLLIITMAGASIAVVAALTGSPWGVFTVGVTVPISMFIGIYLRWLRPGRVAEASLIGVILVLAGVLGGAWFAASPWHGFLTLSREELCLLIPVYSFFAAALPIWLLLVPRDYLSSYIKVGTMLLLVVGVILANLPLLMPAVTPFFDGSGPVLPGKHLFPFLFVTISCGAISGYHSVVCCGTTPKMVENEKDVRLLACGAFLVEGVVAITALACACVLPTGDYFAINTSAEAFGKLQAAYPELARTTPLLSSLETLTHEKMTARPGGAAVLAAGMARLLGGLGWREQLTSFWYHFAIAFQALFILTLIDAGTRAGRYLMQELGGRLYEPFGRANWLPGVFISGGLICGGWGYLLYGGSIEIIWPLFGATNQLLGAMALTLATQLLIAWGCRRRYLLITLLPMLFLLVVASLAEYANFQQYHTNQQWGLAAASALLWLAGIVVIVDSIRHWRSRPFT